MDRWLETLTGARRIMVAVSGGSDSIGLLLALHHALKRDKTGHRLVAATVDHGLRAEAAGEAEEVARLCGELAIPHRIMKWREQKPSTGISAAARDARYRLLMIAADAFGADLMVTGHTLDDQIETVAMRAARNDGQDNLGLAGMAPNVLIDGRRWLARPLLSTRRAAIRSFLKTEGRGWIDDPSNLDDHYERVRVRARIAQGAGASTDAIGLAGVEREMLVKAAADLARQYLTVGHGVLARIPLRFLDQDRDAARHLLAVMTAVLGGRQYLPGKDALDRIIGFLDNRRPGRITAGRVIFDVRGQELFLQREVRNLPEISVRCGESEIWDGRYRVVNKGAVEFRAVPHGPEREVAKALFPDVPASVALRATTTLPAFLPLDADDEEAVDKASVIVAPVLAPYDRFLPQFDYILARELAILLGCNEFPAPPVKVLERKS